MLLDRIRNSMGIQKSVGPLKDDARIMQTLREWTLSSDDSMAISTPYAKSVWVYAAVNVIAQNLAAAPFLLYEKKGKSRTQLPDTDPLVKLFLDPNKYTNAVTLMQGTLVYLCLYGEAFWVLPRSNVTEIPETIWCLDPTRFTPYLEGNENSSVWNGVWEYNDGRQKQLFAPWNIIQFKFMNPYNDIRGLSPLEAAKLGISQDYWTGKFNENFFKNGAAIGGFISVKEGLTKEQFERILSQFNDRHQGVNKAHRIALIDGDAKFTEAKISQKDMDFISLKTITRGEILGALLVNEVVLGNFSNIQSYEGIANARKAFWEECLIPKARLLEETIRSKLFSKLVGRNIIGEFDLSTIEALREDLKLRVDMAKILNEVGFTAEQINERLNLGFKDVKKWQKEWWIKTGVIPASMVLENDIPISPTDSTIAPPKEDKPKEKPQKEDKPKENPPVDEAKKNDEIIIARYKNRQIPLEDSFNKKLRRFFFEQRATILGNIQQAKQEFLDFSSETEKLKTYLQPLYSIASAAGVELLSEEFDFELENKNEIIQDYLLDRLNKNSNKIITTIKAHLTYIIKESHDNNYKTTELVGKIKDYYNKLNNRLSTIARTEVNSIINGTRYAILEALGKHLSIYIKWISASDNGRESHKGLNGKVVKLGTSFKSSSILRFPTDPKAKADEILNCFCYFIPVKIDSL